MEKGPLRFRQSLLISPGLLFIAVLFAGGIFSAENLHMPPLHLQYSILILSGIIFVAAHNRTRSYPAVCCLLLGFLFFLLGQQYGQTCIQTPADPDHIYNIIKDKQSVGLDGILAEHPNICGSIQRFWRS